MSSPPPPPAAAPVYTPNGLLGHATELLRRLEALAQTLLGASREAGDLLLVLGRARLLPALPRLGDAGLRMTLEGALAALEALPDPQRLNLLERLRQTSSPTPGLAAIARSSSLSTIEQDDPTVPVAARRALGLWGGLSPAALGLAPDQPNTLPDDERLAALALLVTPAFPASAEALDALCEALPDAADLLVTRWFTHHDFAHGDADHALLERLSGPEAWLVAVAAMLARGPLPRPLAESFIERAEPGWRMADTPRAVVLADARLAALVGSAGDMASAEGLLRHAQKGLDQENDPRARAELYAVVLAAAASLQTRQLDNPGLGPWLAVVDKLAHDKVMLRTQDAFLAARLAAVRTLPRAARLATDVLDRGHQSLKELCRRVPERWLDLLHLATIAHLQTAAGRSPEVLVAALSDTLRREGLPNLHPAVTLDEVVHHLALAAPQALARLGERIQQPVQRALWFATAIGPLVPPA